MKSTPRCACTNVGIIDLERDECRTGQTVLIADGRIAAIGSSADVPLEPDVLQIDGAGGFIAPGLADMHAHPFSAEDLAVYLAAGVTTIRSMWGEASLLALRREVEAGQRPGPRIVTGGRLVCGSPPYFFGTTGIAEPSEVPEVVAAHVRDGYDFVKIYEKLSRPAFDAVAEETRRQGTCFAGHVPREVPLRHAMQSGMRSAEHLFGYVPAAQLHPECVHLERWFMADFADAVRNFEAIGRGERRLEDEIAPDRIDELAALAAANDFWTVPTLVVLRSIVGRTAYGSDHPQVRYMAPSTADAWPQLSSVERPAIPLTSIADLISTTRSTCGSSAPSTARVPASWPARMRRIRGSSPDSLSSTKSNTCARRASPRQKRCAPQPRRPPRSWVLPMSSAWSARASPPTCCCSTRIPASTSERCDDRWA